MTEYGYDAGMPPPAGEVNPGFLSRAFHAVGAVLSLCLIVGIGLWSWKLIARDVSGVPVVQATQGPMRVAPEDPGGRLADHQGLSVNRIAGTGAAAQPPDSVTLARPPEGLTAEDVAFRALPDVPQGAPGSIGPDDVTIPPDSPLAQGGQRSALVDALTRNATQPENPQQDALSGIDTLDPPDTVPRDAGLGLSRSLRPRARSGGTPDGITLAGAGGMARELPADSIAAGTRLAQIGAFDSPAAAREHWDRIAMRFEAYLEDKDRVIEEARSGGRTFYRLRAHGFTDLADARRFCAALVAGGADCIPAVAR